MNNNELYHYGVKGMKWGHRKNYYGSSGDKYRASNGVTVGAPKNAGVAAFRKVQGSKVGGAAIKGIAKANTAIYGRGKNKASMKRIEDRTRKETDAVREANQAHKQAKKDAKQPMSTKKKVAIGTAVVGTALAAYGTYKVSQYIKDKAALKSFEEGKKYAYENFFNKADIANPIKYDSLHKAGRKTLENTDARTKRMKKSTIESIKYLAHPEKYSVDGDLMRWSK